jgi:hypothetical protein
MRRAALANSILRRFLSRRRAVGCALALAIFLTGGVSARAEQIVDQSYLPFHPASGFDQAYNVWSGSGNLALGQQFVPTLNSLTFVELWMEDAATGTNASANIQLNIRSGSITGTILGTATATVPGGTNTSGGTTLTEFNFSTPIALTPGSTYVLDVSQIAPIVITPPGQSNINFDWIGGPLGSSTYAYGDAYVSGTLKPGFDFAFEEGTATVPEPSAFVLTTTGLLALLGCGLGRRVTRLRSEALSSMPADAAGHC